MIDISLLLSNVLEEIKINEELIFDNTYLENTNIISISPVKISGAVSKDNLENLVLNLNVKGEMILPCSISLEPVNYPFSIDLSEIIDEKDENNLKKDINTLELKPYLWENIVVEIPLRIVSDNAYEKEYKGDGWQLINNEKKKESNNNPFDVLNQLLDKE